MHEIIKLIQQQRFVTIRGIPGIGKSSLCKELANHYFERGAFRNGIIYISLSDCDKIEDVIATFEDAIEFYNKEVVGVKESVGRIA